MNNEINSDNYWGLDVVETILNPNQTKNESEDLNKEFENWKYYNNTGFAQIDLYNEFLVSTKRIQPNDEELNTCIELCKQ